MNTPRQWILLRGLTRDSRHWGEVPANLAARLEADVVTMDLPGNGQLCSQASVTTIEGTAAACRAAILKTGREPPFGLIGLSLGAMVAVAWAEHWPAEVQACVLINTSLPPMSPWYRRLRPSCYGGLLQTLLSPDVRRRERLVLAMTSHRLLTESEERDSLLERWERWGRESPVSRRNALRQILAAWRFRASMTRPVAPTLLLASQSDRLVDVRCSRAIASTWNCTLVEHPWAGHDIPLDDWRWLIEQICGWSSDLVIAAESDTTEVDPNAPSTCQPNCS